MDIIIYDDNKSFCNTLKNNISKIIRNHTTISINSIEIVYNNFENSLENRSLKKSNQSRVYIIDIDLKDKFNGFEIASRIRKFDVHGYIIFLTSHIELMSNSFLYNIKAINYINKSDINFINSLTSSFLQIEKELQTLLKSKEDINKTLNFSDYFSYSFKGRHIKIPFDDIYSIETDLLKRGINIKTRDCSYRHNNTLKEMSLLLPNYFIQCHRVAIINTKHIKEINLSNNSYSAILNNGSTVPISRSKSKIVISMI